MKKTFSKVNLYLNTAKEAVLRSPVEVVLSLMFFSISLYRIVAQVILFDEKYPSKSDIISKIPYCYELENVLYYSFICIAISYSLNIIFHKKGRIFYYLSLLLPVILIFIFIFMPNFDLAFESLSITTICSLLLIYSSRSLFDNRKFASNAIKVTINILSSGALALITLGVITSVIVSFCHIFDMAQHHIVNDIIGGFCLFILIPIFFLTLEYKSRADELKPGRVIDILINYILTPSVLVYGVMLYLYFAKVTILWSLPKGIISTTAIIFIVGGIFVSLCRTVLDKKVLDWVFKYFTYISIPAIVLSWISALYRISEYGLTGNRIYLLITLTILTLWMVVTLSKRYGRFQYLTISIIVAYMAFTYMPYIGYHHFERVEKNKKTLQKKQKQGAIYLHNHFTQLDVKGYNTIEEIYQKNYKLDSNYLKIFKLKSLGVSDTIRVDVIDALDSIYSNAGTKSYKTVADSVVRGMSDIPLVYKKDGIMLVFSSIRYKRFNGEITITDVRPDYMFK